MNIFRSTAGEQLVRQRYEQELASWPVPHERRTVSTREGDTFVLVCGPRDAPPVVLLHGSGGTATSWLHRIGPWAQRFRLYAVDLIGEPGLSAPSRPPLDTEAHTLWLDDVFAALSLEKASLVGESLGGRVALDHAIRRPGRVNRLVLLNPTGIGRQKFGLILKFLLRKVFGSGAAREQMSAAIGFEVPPDAFPLLVFQHFRPRLGKIPVFSDEQLRGLGTPPLVLLGEQDEMLDAPQTARRLATTQPGAEVRLLPGDGHLLLGHSETVRDFLQEVNHV
ncbi:alpha/beta fold hydrolase [Kutzneria albida]|uniref:Alpha/beta hydrolase n=1 Tax=Kutzneria albida DSM 43870 TaxID=1449976 RepID=W5W6D4_9PSEU|nr:alpha/beta fold hydrolase [Kutzneria albida]AHH96753.1 alpha/beta hydrolase [Kutzneria albida DSM 43870]